MNKKWWKYAGIRASRTFCQGMITLIGSDAINVVDIDWIKILGMSVTMALLSLLRSISGLPELEKEEK